MRILSDGEMRFITVEVFSFDASEIGRYWNAIERYESGEDAHALDEFAGVMVLDVETGRRYGLETDPEVVEELGRRGELSFEHIYESL